MTSGGTESFTRDRLSLAFDASLLAAKQQHSHSQLVTLHSSLVTLVTRHCLSDLLRTLSQMSGILSPRSFLQADPRGSQDRQPLPVDSCRTPFHQWPERGGRAALPLASLSWRAECPPRLLQLMATRRWSGPSVVSNTVTASRCIRSACYRRSVASNRFARLFSVTPVSGCWAPSAFR